MARRTSYYSSSKFYHILLKAPENQSLFRNDSDYQAFLKILAGKQRQYAFHLYAYCLVEDHIHLLIEETTKNSLPIILRTTSSLYAKYYQKKYASHGIVFSGRYQSESIHLRKELICRLRFIHQKPKRLGLCAGLSYPYSSYQDYLDPSRLSMIHKNFIYDFFDKNDAVKASRLLSSIHHEMDETVNFDIKDHLYHRVNKAKEILKEELETYQLSYDKLQEANPIRNHLIRRIYQESELTQKEIGDLLNLSRHIVGRVIRTRNI
ncbi:transposase [Vallitaleaceae bacterium 9-2]